MYEFKYHRPATVRQAANLLIKNEDAKVIAGGHTLLPVMKQRLASPPHLIDLSHIEGLDGIEMKGRSLVIGATATHANVASSAIVGEAIPALAELAGLIGDPAVRHKGTIGGSLANNDPTADYPAACLALGATIVTNKRRLKPEEFFQGLFTTALERESPQPSVARSAGRGVRPQARVGCARPRHRRWLRGCVPRHCVRRSIEKALLA